MTINTRAGSRRGTALAVHANHDSAGYLQSDSITDRRPMIDCARAHSTYTHYWLTQTHTRGLTVRCGVGWRYWGLHRRVCVRLSKAGLPQSGVTHGAEGVRRRFHHCPCLLRISTCGSRSAFARPCPSRACRAKSMACAAAYSTSCCCRSSRSCASKNWCAALW